MQTEVFVASRLTRGNLLFPTRILVSDRSVMRSKRSWLRKSEESIHIGNIGNVHIQTGMVWSNIRIESTGGESSFAHGSANVRALPSLSSSSDSPSSIASEVVGSDDVSGNELPVTPLTAWYISGTRAPSPAPIVRLVAPMRAT